ncbi:MAG: cell division protein SepF [Saccharofermentanales bacterium]|jgi:cell division inhibitor SepF
MAEFINKLLNKFGHGYDEDYYEDEYEEIQYEDTAVESDPVVETRFPFRRGSNKVVDLRSGNSQNQVVIMQPADIEAAQQACDHVRSGKTVICNIEKVEPKIAQRVIDFITGSAYALDGRVMPVSSAIFVVAPRNTALLEGALPAQGSEYYRNAVNN